MFSALPPIATFDGGALVRGPDPNSTCQNHYAERKLAIQSAQIEWLSDRVREYLRPGIKPLGMAQ